MTPGEADKLVPQINLSSILKSLVPESYNIDRIIVMAPKYLKDLSKLLDDTPMETLHTYIAWKVVQTFNGYIEADALVPYKRFQNELQGKVSGVTVAASCLRLILYRTLIRRLNVGGNASTMLTAALAGFSVDSSLRKRFLQKPKPLETRLFRTSRTNSSRSSKSRTGWRRRSSILLSTKYTISSRRLGTLIK